MADCAQRRRDACSGDEQGNLKKRKIRKGTRSCWECKRRKARCSLSQTRDISVCDGCKRRGTRCVGQEYPDAPSKQHVGERLGRVEDLLTSLGREINTTTPNNSVQFEDRQSICPVNTTTTKVQPGSEQTIHSLCLPPTEELKYQKFSRISKALLSAWPTAEDLEVIVTAPMGTASVFRGLIFVSYEDFMKDPLPSPRELLIRPESNLHPVMIARKLLMLAIFLQNLSSTALAHVSSRLAVDSAELMESAFDTATQLVTNNDELTGSMEGVECIMMVSLYLNNSSRLKLAYLAIRRALVIAQMIGIDQGKDSSQIRILDQETRKRMKPEFMWFRLIQTDRYLSLQQGLPQGYLGDTLPIENLKYSLSPIERLEQVLTIAAGQIIQRNSSEMLDPEATRKVDDMLLKGADSMSPQWWLCPDVTDSLQDERAVLRESNRLLIQLAYFEILERLHLPFLLQPSNLSHEYSKMVAVTASREVLARYIVFRGSSPPKGTFCRGIDFLAFSASVVTCLGHINMRLRNSRQEVQQSERENAVFDCLSHQRLGDRGMMERALACLEKVLEDDASDKTAQKICGGMRYLLAVEGDVASGMAYRSESTYRNEDARDELGCENQPGDDERAIRIHIPHLGMIKIEPHGATGMLFMSATSTDPSDIGTSLPNTNECDSFLPSDAYSSNGEYREHTGGRTDPHAWPLGDLGRLCLNLEEPQSSQWPIAGNGWEDEWLLEGMNSAFFDSLFSGSYKG
ncbi:hypothetical protein DM02DRAFT_519077 [Periconia macrospinosa]|uniref:Zn(2)-C6 fungal-type domain-containing protein n=1 Tax=Periconia macrospinosa TaxID=97972 RepID=A0A2V1E488_9PLEO|nr:hypothetical protein DM02DRAFT_519077 [Periconia macrospinosa]